jgi:sigma-B regulation protein RsbU (phosphoserine phosphatase)
MLMLLIVMGFSSYLIYELSSSLVEELQLDSLENTLKASVQKVRRVLSDVYVGTTNHVPEIEESLGQPDRLFVLMERIVSLNPHIRSCGISFVDGYYPQKGRWFCPYAVKRDSGQIALQNIGDADHDYLKAKWFTEVLETEKGRWSKPFFEGNDTITPLVSYLAPIHDKQGRTVAVLGADVSLEWLSNILKHMKLVVYGDTLTVKPDQEEYKNIDKRYGKTYSFIIDGDGTYIAHYDDSHVLRDNFLKETEATADTLDDYLCRRMLEGKKGCYPDDSDSDGDLTLGGHSVYMLYAPIEHTDWSMAIVVPAIDVKLLAVVVGIVLLLLIAISLLVVYFMGRYLIKKTAKPLHQLATSANEVAKGHFDTQLPTIKHNDEIRMLRDSFEHMEESLTKYVEELKATTASKAAIENELKVAHDIQMSMLPKIFPPYPDRSDIDIAGSLNPAKDVGGDLFDFYIHDDQLFFCIGDVSGKGVPASLVMAVTRSLFRNVSTHESEPSRIVATLNEALVENNEASMFVTFFAGVLDLKTGLMRYSNAGHDAPLLTGRGVGLLPCDPNLPLGIMPDWEYTSQEVVIDPQTVIFLFTDGLNEAEDIRHAQFGNERIIEVAEHLLAEGENIPSTLISQMTEAVHAFVGDAEQSDDLTMLAIKYKK